MADFRGELSSYLIDYPKMVARLQKVDSGKPSIAQEFQPEQLSKRAFGCLVQYRMLILQLVLGLALVCLGVSGKITLANTGALNLLADTFLIAAGVTVLGRTLWVIWRSFVEPLEYLREWALHLRGGNLTARIPVPEAGHFVELARDLNSLGEMLQSLARDTEQQLQRHTEYTAQKTHSLSILYDVAASINVSRDLDDLLSRFLHTLTDVVGAKAATIRLLTDDGKMKLAASIGLNKEIIERERELTVEECLGVKNNDAAEIFVKGDMTTCDRGVDSAFCAGEECKMVIVPLQYRGRTLGVYNLYVDTDTYSQKDDFKALSTSIGRHLGMAIDKARLDEETKRLSIMEERTRLAHELHDSLAQTLASIRFQARVLDETMRQGDEAAMWQDLERIENSIDEAHTELRELIAHFRAPVNEGGLISSIEQSVQRFRRESPDIHVFLQKEWPEQALPAEYEIQVLRVVQEALANVRKHGQANAVRVMLSGNDNGNYKVLVEDDGVGMIETSKSDTPGEHVGLSIMEDRARRIGGKLSIDSDPGEGVRVILRFSYSQPNGINSTKTLND